MSLARRPAKEGGFSTLRPSRKVTKRSQDPVVPEVHAAVFHRDGGCLLRGILHPGFEVPCSGPEQWHHRLPVEYGGHSLVSNGMRVCFRHHDRIGRYRAVARLNGWLLRRGQDPSKVAVTLSDGRRVYFDHDGDYRDAGPALPGSGEGQERGTSLDGRHDD